MAKINFVCECPGCKTKEKLSVKKPGFLRPEVVSYKCAVCESWVSVEVAVAGVSGKALIKRKISPSPLLVAMIEEEKEEEKERVRRKK